MTGNPSLPELMVQQETAQIMNSSRIQDMQMKQKEMQQKDFALQEMQAEAAKAQAALRPASTPEVQGKLATMSGMQQSKYWMESETAKADRLYILGNKIGSEKIIEEARQTRNNVLSYQKHLDEDRGKKLEQAGGVLGSITDQSSMDNALTYLQENDPDKYNFVVKNIGQEYTVGAAQKIQQLSIQSVKKSDQLKIGQEDQRLSEIIRNNKQRWEETKLRVAETARSTAVSRDRLNQTIKRDDFNMGFKNKALEEVILNRKEKAINAKDEKAASKLELDATRRILTSEFKLEGTEGMAQLESVQDAIVGEARIKARAEKIPFDAAVRAVAKNYKDELKTKPTLWDKYAPTWLGGEDNTEEDAMSEAENAGF